MEGVNAVPLEERIFQEYGGIPVPKFKVGQKVWFLFGPHKYYYGKVDRIVYATDALGGAYALYGSGLLDAMPGKNVFATAEELREYVIHDFKCQVAKDLISCAEKAYDMSILPEDLQPKGSTTV